MRKSIGVIVGLALTTAFFAGCGSKPTMEESIAAIEKLGGGFSDDGKVLEFMSTEITDAGLVHLEGMTGLEQLYLFNTNITGAGLAHLKGLTGLKLLDLQNIKITDAELTHLEGMTGLEKLNLHGTGTTDAGVDNLQAALPECTINH